MKRIKPYKLIILAAILALLVLFPLYGSAYMVSTLSLIMLYMAMGQMWNLMSGYTGLLSLGMQAFIGIGGYSLAVFSVKFGMNIYPAILIGGILSVLFALVVSPALFKMTGVYFAIGSWIVAEALLIAFSNWSFVGYAKGVNINTVYHLPGNQIYYTAAALGVGTVLLVFLLMRSKTGLALMAMRDSLSAAESMGVEIFKTKLYCYLLASFVMGLAGGVMYMIQAYIVPKAGFDIQWTVAMTFIVIIGGVGTMEGPIIGAVVYVILTQFLFDFPGFAMIILGAVAVAAILIVPNGIMGTLYHRTGFEILSARRYNQRRGLR